MDKIYILIGDTWSHEASHMWIAGVYTSREQADTRQKLLTDIIRPFWDDESLVWEQQDLQTELRKEDPHAEVADYIKYTVQEHEVFV